MSYRQDWVRYITQRAPVYGLDPKAALAVAMTEGLSGGVGDHGTSFGPFQLHVGGALPQGRDQAWAESPEGVDYALRTMSNAGARGQVGQEAINTIVRKFERPADPDSQVAKAIGYYGDTTGGGAATSFSPTPAATLPNLGSGSDPRPAILSFLLSGQAPTPQGLMHALMSARQQGDFSANPSMPSVPTGSQGSMPGIQTLPWDPSKPAKVETLPYDPAKQQPVIRPLRTEMGAKSEFGIVDPEGAPAQNGTRYHAGKDWFAPAGSSVSAPIGGKIIEAKPSRGNSGQVFGGTVKVQGRDGKVFVFRHVDPSVQVGQIVSPGDPIAGVTAWKDGSPHAHIEVWKALQGGYTFENMLDPISFFR